MKCQYSTTLESFLLSTCQLHNSRLYLLFLQQMKIYSLCIVLERTEKVAGGRGTCHVPHQLSLKRKSTQLKPRVPGSFCGVCDTEACSFKQQMWRLGKLP